jgi:ELWxxDGT repeat protein
MMQAVGGRPTYKIDGPLQQTSTLPTKVKLRIEFARQQSTGPIILPPRDLVSAAEGFSIGTPGPSGKEVSVAFARPVWGMMKVIRADRVKRRCRGRKLTLAVALFSALALGVPGTRSAPAVAGPAHRVKDINPGLSSDYSAEVLVTTAKAAFFEATVAGNTGLWITDGTVQGTRFLKDVPSGGKRTR